MEGWLYDGEKAVRRAARIVPAPEGLRLVLDGGEETVLPPSLLHHLESRSDAELYGRADRPGWRLGMPKPLDPALAGRLPAAQTYGRWVDRIGLARALVAGAAASAALFFLGHKAPDLLAPLVPVSWEQHFGRALLGDLDARVCADNEGQRALDALAARLSPEARNYEVRVADLPFVNAVALPGGTIIIFKDLLIEAKGPDEVAGVLGHEIGHVENRDVTRALIRHYGFGILLSLVGGSTGGNVETLMAASHGREAEARADDHAIAALARARISPRPTAGFFARLARQNGNLGSAMTYLSSHPAPADRQAKFARSEAGDGRYRPALAEEEWLALQDICRAPPKKRDAFPTRNRRWRLTPRR